MDPKTPRLSPKALAKYIDHTLLRPDAADADLRRVCDEAREFSFCTVCVYWHQIPKIAAWLEGTGVLPIAVVGFPGGEVPTQEKVSETHQAVAAGAREIDMVLNRPLFRRDPRAALADVRAVVEAAAPHPVKLILETSELSQDEKVAACRLAVEAGAAWVKTSTGFSKSGATAEDVRLMKATVGERARVKASGGIRSFETAWAMIQAGAERLGTSASAAIIAGAGAAGDGY